MTREERPRTETRAALLVAVGLLWLSGGCRRNHSSDDAQVRLFNASSAGERVSVLLADRSWKEADPGRCTGYDSVKPGIYQVGLRIGGDQIAPRPVTLEKSERYTAVALDAPGRFRLYRMATGEPVATGMARVCFVNALAGLASVDIVLNNIVADDHLALGDRTHPTVLAAGDYSIKILPAGGIRPAGKPVTVRLAGGRTYLAILTGDRDQCMITLLDD